MKFAALNRDEFIAWLNGRPILNGEILDKKLPKLSVNGKINVVWDIEDETISQPIVAVPKGDLKDFFAFVSTYVTAYKPFSAFFKVVSCEWLERRQINLARHQLSKILFSKLVAVSFAEAFAQSQGKLSSLDDLTLQGVKATLSSSLQSAVWQGHTDEELAQIAEGWSEARSIVSGGPLQISPKIVLEVWQEIAVGLMNSQGSKRLSKKRVAFHLRQFLGGSEDFEGWFLPIAQECIGPRFNLDRMLGAREDRVRLLPDLVEAASVSKSSGPMLEFVVGGIASLVGNGSMAQIKLTEGLVKDFPSSPLWFGVTSALQSRSDALVASNCLGRRANRDILRDFDFFDAPSYDISLDELLVIGEKAFTKGTIRTAHSGTFEVGLLGDVKATLKRVSVETKNETAISHQDRMKIDLKQIDELGYLLERARRLVNEVRRPSQRDFFDRDVDNPYRNR